MLFSITAYAAGPVTPKTQFNYSGTDIVRSTDSLYRTENAYFKDEADVLPINTEREIWEKLSLKYPGYKRYVKKADKIINSL